LLVLARNGDLLVLANGVRCVRSGPELDPAAPWTRSGGTAPADMDAAVIPGSVPGELLLIRTGDAAVSVGGVCAYGSGKSITYDDYRF
jgi:hypothetical protein